MARLRAYLPITMRSLDRFLPSPRHAEVDHVDVAVPPGHAYEIVRHLDFARAPIARALFALRTIPARLSGREPDPPDLRIDAITTAGAGFQMLEDRPGSGFTVGAIGRFWRPSIEFADVPSERFAAFAEPGWGKIAWQLGVEPRGERDARITFELRIDATDDEAWRAFRRYYALIGPFSHFMRRHLLATLAHDLGTPDLVESTRALPGDEILGDDAKTQVTHHVDVEARPEDVWPWLVQMGCRRGGWYSWDLLDNGGVPSAREILPEHQHVAVGDLLPATPDDEEGFRVLRVDPARALVLGATVDLDGGRLAAEDAPLPERYWRVTWAFVLEALDERTTRLHVRVRADWRPARIALRAVASRLAHSFMEAEQLRTLKARVEGHARAPRVPQIVI